MLKRISPSARSKMMSAVGKRNTKPEREVRRILHREGFRFKLHAALPGTPDIVLPKYRTALFVHGCFWHQCPHCGMAARRIDSNRSYWLPKLERNRARDARVQQELADLGWQALVIWECQTKDAALLQRLRKQIKDNQPRTRLVR